MSGHSLSFPATGSAPGQDLSAVEAELNAVGTPASVAVPVARRTGALSTGAYEAVKRGMDIVASLAALIVLSPFLALIALVIKLQDGGSIFYAHTRVGKGGREFKFYKFRSMIRDADRLTAQLAGLNEHTDPRTFKMKRDPRITPFGRILRRASLDELPQLWNIFKGDMTLVGPRPPLPCEVALYTLEDRRRLEVTPGLTCLWQVRGRGNLPFSEQVKLDVEYIEKRSLLLDLEILAQTIPAVISGRGAY
jgi:lipopolysaccharide/colanic/teichoic acid biosynthesis glycosyltransferase